MYKIDKCIETRSAPASLALPSQVYLLSQKSLSSIPGFLIPNMFVCCVVTEDYFGETAEIGTRAACAPQIRGIRVIRGCLLLPLFVSIRVQLLAKGFGFVVGSENLKKFSLNPVEGISTSASMCSFYQ